MYSESVIVIVMSLMIYKKRHFWDTTTPYECICIRCTNMFADRRTLHKYEIISLHFHETAVGKAYRHVDILKSDRNILTQKA